MSWKEDVKLLAKSAGLEDIPERIEEISFFMPIPRAMTKKQRERVGTPHKQTPDIDNLFKAFTDAICKRDEHIWFVGRQTKTWSMPEDAGILLTLRIEL